MSLKQHLHQKKKTSTVTKSLPPENIIILEKDKMKDSSSKLNQYCSIHRYVHKEAYELCDYCMEHKHYLHHRDKYCNYGFSKHNIAICKACEDDLFGGGKYRIIIADEPYDMYERICQVIKDRTTKTMKGEGGGEQQITIEYFEAVRIAYLKNTQHFIEYFGDDDICYNEINKNFKGLWRLTYRFVNEEQRIKVVNKDPDNLLISWVPGCYTGFDIPKKSMLV